MYIYQGEHIYKADSYSNEGDYSLLLITVPLFVVGISALACCCGGDKVAPQEAKKSPPTNKAAADDAGGADDDYEYEEDYPDGEAAGGDNKEPPSPADLKPSDPTTPPAPAPVPDPDAPVATPALAEEETNEEAQSEEEVWEKEGTDDHTEIKKVKCKTKTKVKQKSSNAMMILDKEPLEDEHQKAEIDLRLVQQHPPPTPPPCTGASPKGPVQQPTDITKVKILQQAQAPAVVEPKEPTMDAILKAKNAYRESLLIKGIQPVNPDEDNFYAPMLAKK